MNNEKDQQLFWTTEKRKISELKDFPKNPRILNKKQQQLLDNSIKRFGYVEIIAIDRDNTILAGHMRVKILKKNNIKELEVRVPSRPLTEKEREEYVITSNKATGEWDYDNLANEWNAEELVALGFDPTELFEGIDIDSEKEKKGKQKKEHECPSCGFKFL